MPRSTQAGLALLVVAGSLMVAPSAGVMSVVGDRGADVVTATDASAYLSLEPREIELSNGRHESVVLLELRNRLPAPLTSVSVTIADVDPRPPRPQSTGYPRSLDIAERAPITAAIVCGGPSDRTERWQIDIVARGIDSYVALSRTVEIDCSPPTRGATGPMPSPPPSQMAESNSSQPAGTPPSRSGS